MVLSIPIVPGLHNPLIISVATYLGEHSNHLQPILLFTSFYLTYAHHQYFSPSPKTQYVPSWSCHLLPEPISFTFFCPFWGNISYSVIQARKQRYPWLVHLVCPYWHSLWQTYWHSLWQTFIMSHRTTVKISLTILHTHTPETPGGNLIMSHFLNPSMVSHCARN